MSTAGTVEVMRRNGIVRPGEVLELAKVAGLDLAAGCVLLVKESGGGRNIWGHDGVDTLGSYDKGSVVDRDHYMAYLRIRDTPQRKGARAQGVGPTQLTAWDIQDAADRAGGCWDWRTNVLVGFRHLAGLIGRFGERGGFVAYNGGPGALTKAGTHPAQLYGDDAVRKLAAWRLLLSPELSEVDVPLTPQDAQMIADAVWRRPTRNGMGDVVGAEQILAGTETRVADVQNQVHAHLPAGPPSATSPVMPGGVDLEALAELVVDRLAARLGKT